MGRKLRHVLIFLLIILKEPSMPDAGCWDECEYHDHCRCVRMGLTSIPQDLPTTLTHLYLHGNLITSLTKLCLGSNKLSVLPESAYDIFTSILIVEIGKNPWQCDCRMAPFRLQMNESDFFAFEDQIVCSQPGRFSGQKLKDINVTDLICEVSTTFIPIPDQSGYNDITHRPAMFSGPMLSTRPKTWFVKTIANWKVIKTRTTPPLPTPLTVTGRLPPEVVIACVFGSIAAYVLINSIIRKIWYKTRTGNPRSGNDPTNIPNDPRFQAQLAALQVNHTYGGTTNPPNSRQDQSPTTKSNTNTTATEVTSDHDHDHQYENNDQHNSSDQDHQYENNDQHNPSDQDHQYENNDQHNPNDQDHQYENNDQHDPNDQDHQYENNDQQNPRDQDHQYENNDQHNPSDQDHQYENNDQHNHTNTDTTADRDDDHQYEDVDNKNDQTGQGRSLAITKSNTNTTATVVTGDDDHEYEDVDGQQNQRRQGQCQAIAQSNTNTTATEVTGDDDHGYEDVDGQQNQRRQGQCQAIAKANTNTIALTSDHDHQYEDMGIQDYHTGQGKSQIPTINHGKSLDATNVIYTTEPAATQIIQPVYTCENDKTGQVQAQAITDHDESLDSRNEIYMKDSAVSKPEPVYMSENDQTGQGQTQAVNDHNEMYISNPEAAQPNYVYKM
ncbi:hypothetical protein Bbelb_332640 [Branchiostoma belcheri]|nr:hypothetical protein Bbelb_332640 [Branchiostoma belcheri]